MASIKKKNIGLFIRLIHNKIGHQTFFAVFDIIDSDIAWDCNLLYVMSNNNIYINTQKLVLFILKSLFMLF